MLFYCYLRVFVEKNLVQIMLVAQSLTLQQIFIGFRRSVKWNSQGTK